MLVGRRHANIVFHGDFREGRFDSVCKGLGYQSDRVAGIVTTTKDARRETNVKRVTVPERKEQAAEIPTGGTGRVGR
jgi:hypothetical protein